MRGRCIEKGSCRYAALGTEKGEDVICVYNTLRGRLEGLYISAQRIYNLSAFTVNSRELKHGRPNSKPPAYPLVMYVRERLVRRCDQGERSLCENRAASPAPHPFVLRHRAIEPRYSTRLLYRKSLFPSYSGALARLSAFPS